MRYLVLFMLFTCNLCAQNKTYWDTTRYQKFRSNLIVGLFQFHRNFNTDFNQLRTPDEKNISNNNYYAESNQITGIEVNYDKFSLGFAIKSTPQKNSTGKGNTQTLNGNFNFGGNIWFMENSFRYFKGFYDSNTAAYDSSFNETGNYYYQPNFTNTLIRSKFLFFTNHKRYAFRSSYACNYRQLKSSATWIFSANTVFNYLHNDSSFFAPASRPFYSDYENMNGISVFGISATAGGAATLVLWKAFFVTILFVVGPEQQWRTYDYLDAASQELSYLSITGDLRASIGVNFKRFYFMSFSRNDFSYYNSSAVDIKSRSLSGGLILGWRFNSKVPGFYKKFQSTKLYSSF